MTDGKIGRLRRMWLWLWKSRETTLEALVRLARRRKSDGSP